MKQWALFLVFLFMGRGCWMWGGRATYWLCMWNSRNSGFSKQDIKWLGLNILRIKPKYQRGWIFSHTLTVLRLKELGWMQEAKSSTVKEPGQALNLNFVSQERGINIQLFGYGMVWKLTLNNNHILYCTSCSSGTSSWNPFLTLNSSNWSTDRKWEKCVHLL